MRRSVCNLKKETNMNCPNCHANITISQEGTCPSCGNDISQRIIDMENSANTCDDFLACIEFLLNCPPSIESAVPYNTTMCLQEARQRTETPNDLAHVATAYAACANDASSEEISWALDTLSKAFNGIHLYNGFDPHPDYENNIDRNIDIAQAATEIGKRVARLLLDEASDRLRDASGVPTDKAGAIGRAYRELIGEQEAANAKHELLRQIELFIGEGDERKAIEEHLNLLDMIWENQTTKDELKQDIENWLITDIPVNNSELNRVEAIIWYAVTGNHNFSLGSEVQERALTMAQTLLIRLLSNNEQLNRAVSHFIGVHSINTDEVVEHLHDWALSFSQTSTGPRPALGRLLLETAERILETQSDCINLSKRRQLWGELGDTWRNYYGDETRAAHADEICEELYRVEQAETDSTGEA